MENSFENLIKYENGKRSINNLPSDQVAGLFLESSNLIPISIIKGHSASDAHDNSKKQMLKTMKKLMKSEQSRETPLYLEALWNNYSGQVIHGNKKAKL